MLVGGCGIKEADQLFRGVTSFNVQFIQATTFTTDRTSWILQLYLIEIAYGAVASDERLYSGDKRCQTVGVEIVGGVEVSLEMDG